MRGSPLTPRLEPRVVGDANREVRSQLRYAEELDSRVSHNVLDEQV